MLATPLGKLDTINTGADSDERGTEIWRAEKWFFLLTPIEQVNSSGLRIKLELESATVAGKSVVAQERLF